MAGPRYGVTNLLDGATITPTAGTAAGYAIVDFYSQRPSKVWLSGGTAADQRINIDLGSAKTANLMAVLNHNFPLASTIKLEKSTTGAWAGEQVHVRTFTIRALNMYFSFLTPESSRYWSLHLQDSDGAAGAFPSAPKIGELGLYDSVQLTRPFVRGGEFEKKQINITHTTPSGNPWMAHISDLDVLKLGWDDLSDSELDEIKTMHTATAGAAVPFTLVVSPDNPTAAKAAEVYFVKVSDVVSWIEEVNNKKINFGFVGLPVETSLS